METVLQFLGVLVFVFCMWKIPNSFSLVLLIIGLALGLGICAMQGELRHGYALVDQLLRQVVGWFIGVGGIVGFVGHTFMAEKIATSIGWARSPFQFEVACASLAFGSLGILTNWFQGGFLAATALGWSVFLLGAAVGHAREMISEQNFSANNAGVIFYMDIVGPVCLFTLLGITYL